jgi:hypothetical protein
VPIPVIGLDEPPSGEYPKMATALEIGRLMLPAEVLLPKLEQLEIRKIAFHNSTSLTA